jgi:hypothetical protein
VLQILSFIRSKLLIRDHEQQQQCSQKRWSGASTEVVARHPLGIPGGAEIKAFTPYRSKALLHKIDINIACQNDWDRQNPDPNSKPPFLEFGLFSGDDLRAEVRGFALLYRSNPKAQSRAQ